MSHARENVRSSQLMTNDNTRHVYRKAIFQVTHCCQAVCVDYGLNATIQIPIAR